MIEKLKRCIREEDGIKISCPPDNGHIIGKINEIIDVINSVIKPNRPPFARDSFDFINGKFTPKDELPDGDDAIQEVIHTDPFAEQKSGLESCVSFGIMTTQMIIILTY